jgi:hypothetical protein
VGPKRRHEILDASSQLAADSSELALKAAANQLSARGFEELIGLLERGVDRLRSQASEVSREPDEPESSRRGASPG